MRPDCKANVEQAIGRELAPGEAEFIDRQLVSQLREDARENPGRFKATNRAQRLRVAGARAAQKIARGQAVVDWSDQDRDLLSSLFREEAVKAGFDVNVETSGRQRAAATWYPGEDVIRFAINAIKGKTVNDAFKSLQGVLSHELIHVARSFGAIDDAHWAQLTAAASQLHFRRKDAERVGVLDTWLELSRSKKNPTYQDFANFMYSDLDEQGRQEEAVAAAIEVEGARRAAELSSQGQPLLRALGALLKLGRSVLRAISRLSSPQQASLRAFIRASEQQLRSGELAKQQYEQTTIEFTNPVKIKISDEVLNAIPREEIDDLVRRLEDPLAQPAQIMDAPFFETLRGLEGETSITSKQAADILNGPVNQQVKDKFSSFAGGKGPKKGYRAVVLTGAPGAGKTKIASEISKRTRSAYLSADLANEVAFGGGIKSNSRYAEANAITKRVAMDMLPTGANVVIERIGDDINAIGDQIKILRHMGYAVDVVHVRSDFSNRVRGAAARALSTGRWPSAADQIRIGNKPTSVHKTVNRLDMANGTYEVRLGKDGNYRVINSRGKPSAALSRAITAASGGRLARVGQTIAGAANVEPREYSLQFAKLFREQQRRWGVEPEHRPMDNFAGRRAKGANLTALGIAQQMDKEGVDKNTIRHQTGWFKTGVKNWQYILPSGKITLKEKFHEHLAQGISVPTKTKGKLSDFIDTPAFEAYPSLRRVPITIDIHGEETGGSSSPFGITIKRPLDGQTYEQLFAHEIQHKISAIEKFERGGSPSVIESALRKGRGWGQEIPQWVRSYTDEITDENASHVTHYAFMLYHALTDEVRARESEELESMSQEDRENYYSLVMGGDTFSDQWEMIGPYWRYVLENIPLKFYAKWVSAAGVGGVGVYNLARFIFEYLAPLINPGSSASQPEGIASAISRLENVVAGGRQIEQPLDAPQEYRLKKVQAVKFLDFSSKYTPVKRAMEAAGIDGAPTAFTRDQFVRLRRALFDITDLTFLDEMGPLARKYGRGKANKQFQLFEKDRRDFAAFLENGVMDGGFATSLDSTAQPMDARKSKAYTAPGGKTGFIRTSGTSYTHIPTQPGYEDLVREVITDLRSVPTKRFLGETIQDKGPKGTYKLLFGAGKWLDQLDHDAEQYLLAKWGKFFNKIPIVKKAIQSYFPFGGVPDEVVFQAIRSHTAGRVGASTDTASRTATDLKLEMENHALSALGVPPSNRSGFFRDFHKNTMEVTQRNKFNEQMADINERVRRAIIEEDGAVQQHLLNALPGGVRAATIKAIETIDEVGSALVEAGVIHIDQYMKRSGHYLRRAYARYLEKYSPPSGLRASGAHYRKMRENRGESTRLLDGEIKDVPFLAFLSIEQPLRDLAVYNYWNALAHYGETAPSNPGWFLPETQVMWDGKYRSLYWVAQELDQAKIMLNSYKSEYSSIGGAKATAPIAAELRRVIRIQTATVNAMEAIVKAHPLYSRALDKEDLPKGYMQLPLDVGKFGDKAGSIVLKAIGQDATVGLDRSGQDEVEKASQRMWRVFNRNQKMLLTVLNPTTHFRNTYSNSMMLAREGSNLVEVPIAVSELWDHYNNGRTSPGVRALLKSGLLRQTLSQAELRQMDVFATRVQKLEKRAKLRKNVEAMMGSGSPAETVLSAIDVAGAVAFGLKNAYAQSMSFAYEMEDAVFRLAKINDELKRGTPPTVAAAEARRIFGDYSQVTPIIRWLRNSMFAPFVSFSYISMPNAARNVGTAPWRMLYTSYVWPFVLSALFMAMAGYDDDEGRKAMSENMRERMLMPLPFRDEHGRTRWVDGIYLLPEGAAVGAIASASRADVMGIGQSLGVVGGPALNVLVGLKSGYDPFRGTEIWEETDDDAMRTAKAAGFVTRQFIPSTYAYYAPPLFGELQGGPGFEALFGTGLDRNGEPGVDSFQMVSRFFGINTYTSDFNYDMMKRLNEYEYRINDLSRELDNVYRNESLTPERQQARIDYLDGRIDYLIKRRDRLLLETANASREEGRRNSVTNQ